MRIALFRRGVRPPLANVPFNGAMDLSHNEITPLPCVKPTQRGVQHPPPPAPRRLCQGAGAGGADPDAHVRVELLRQPHVEPFAHAGVAAGGGLGNDPPFAYHPHSLALMHPPTCTRMHTLAFMHPPTCTLMHSRTLARAHVSSKDTCAPQTRAHPPKTELHTRAHSYPCMQPQPLRTQIDRRCTNICLLRNVQQSARSGSRCARPRLPPTSESCSWRR